jgi:hypothetical protein
VDRSSAMIARCTFTDNLARGRDGGTLQSGLGDLGIAQGGAIANTEGSVMTVEDSTFTGNRAIGGDAGSAGVGANYSFIGISIGGAISNHDTSALTLTRSTLTGNQAIGGDRITGGQRGQNWLGGAFGGGLFNEGSMEVSDSVFDRNDALGGSASRAGNPLDVLGVAWGGAIDTIGAVFGGTGSLIVTNSSFTGNRAIGGRGAAGGSGAEALGGAIRVGSFNPSVITNASVAGCVLSGNQAVGGQGGTGGNGADGLGGGIYIDASSNLTVRATTSNKNTATGGGGAIPGQGIGGGIYLAPGSSACLDAFTVANTRRNHASTSDDDIFGVYAICP